MWKCVRGGEVLPCLVSPCAMVWHNAMSPNTPRMHTQPQCKCRCAGGQCHCHHPAPCIQPWSHTHSTFSGWRRIFLHFVFKEFYYEIFFLKIFLWAVAKRREAHIDDEYRVRERVIYVIFSFRVFRAPKHDLRIWGSVIILRESKSKERERRAYIWEWEREVIFMHICHERNEKSIYIYAKMLASESFAIDEKECLSIIFMFVLPACHAVSSKQNFPWEVFWWALYYIIFLPAPFSYLTSTIYTMSYAFFIFFFFIFCHYFPRPCHHAHFSFCQPECFILLTTTYTFILFQEFRWKRRHLLLLCCCPPFPSFHYYYY